MRNASTPKDVRERCFPGLIQEGLPGSGRQFLDFHRKMIREFKWYVINTPGPRYDYRPWRELPAWLAGLMDASLPQYREHQLATIDSIIQCQDADDLGHFLEGCGPHNEPGLHGYVHGLVSAYECVFFGKQPLSDMASQATAIYNEHFWGLHGWIDKFYANWQRLRGELVDQSPLAPDPHPAPMCPECQPMPGMAMPMNFAITEFVKQKNEQV
jgi:hypothetical protein